MDNNHLRVCKKEIKADLVLKNAQILNVFTDEIINGDVAIYQDTIVGIGNYEGYKEIDCTNKYLSAGFIDAHMHIESTMLAPLELSKLLVSKGTTTIIADPHEIVNVSGKLGLDYIIEATDDLPLNIYLMVPSSVPALDIDINGSGEFLSSEMIEYLNNNKILGLGEVMRFDDVIDNECRMQDKLKLFKDKFIDGHAPRVSNERLQAYFLQGVVNDHECDGIEEALLKLRTGFILMVREGSAARNLEKIVVGLLKHNIPFDRCIFCTDDKHIEDIENEGHISYCVKKAISLGVDPMAAYKMATYNSARAYNLNKMGAIAVGYQADILILDDLNTVKINTVIKDGKVVDEVYLACFKQEFNDKYDGLLNTVKIPMITSDDLKIKLKDQQPIIKLIPYSLLTKLVYQNFPNETYFKANKQYAKLCVIERYGKTHHIAAAILEGYGIENGAIASSISHDAHNIIVVGDNDADIIKAVQTIDELQGGYVVVSNGKVLAQLQLNLGGLITLNSKDYVKKNLNDLLTNAYKLNVSKDIDPLITLSFIALGVIPEVRLLECGLYNVSTKEMII